MLNTRDPLRSVQRRGLALGRGGLSSHLSGWSQAGQGHQRSKVKRPDGSWWCWSGVWWCL